jgi:hypothetical protein
MYTDVYIGFKIIHLRHVCLRVIRLYMSMPRVTFEGGSGGIDRNIRILAVVLNIARFDMRSSEL